MWQVTSLDGLCAPVPRVVLIAAAVDRCSRVASAPRCWPVLSCSPASAVQRGSSASADPVTRVGTSGRSPRVTDRQVSGQRSSWQRNGDTREGAIATVSRWEFVRDPDRRSPGLLRDFGQLDCDDQLVGTPTSLPVHGFQDIAADEAGGAMLRMAARSAPKSSSTCPATPTRRSRAFPMAASPTRHPAPPARASASRACCRAKADPGSIRCGAWPPLHPIRPVVGSHRLTVLARRRPSGLASAPSGERQGCAGPAARMTKETGFSTLPENSPVDVIDSCRRGIQVPSGCRP